MRTPAATPTGLPRPKEHHTAPSAAGNPAGCSSSCPIPRQGSIIPHPRQQMRSQTTIITAPSFTQGARSYALGGGYPANYPPNPRYPTPKEHHNVPSAAETHARCNCNRPFQHPRSTTMHPRRQKPEPAQPAPRVSPTPSTRRSMQRPRDCKSRRGALINAVNKPHRPASSYQRGRCEPCGSPPAANCLNRADHSWKPV